MRVRLRSRARKNARHLFHNADRRDVFWTPPNVTARDLSGSSIGRSPLIVSTYTGQAIRIAHDRNWMRSAEEQSLGPQPYSTGLSIVTDQ